MIASTKLDKPAKKQQVSIPKKFEMVPAKIGLIISPKAFLNVANDEIISVNISSYELA